ncbi:MAG: hypothetical protein DMG24_10000 [Acidobacteria bacterium]|nr:MAG: hypothetical protein DMG24_10000 [Acidobacteriota bacterium]
MGTLLQDLRYGLRMLAKNPGFTTVAVLTLALGIGANTALFSVMNAVMLRYLPVPDPERLVYLNSTGRPSGTFETGIDDFSFSEFTFERLRTEQRVFSHLVAFVPLAFDVNKVAVRYGEEPEQAWAEMVSGNFFSGLGVTPARGRLLTLEDEREHTQVAVLSYDYWNRRFARNPSVIGQTLYIKGVPFTVTGIAAPDFRGVEPWRPTDVWIPLQNRPDLTAWGVSAQDGPALYGSPNWWCLMMIGRLAPGVSQQQAIAQLTPIFQRAAYEGVGTRNPKECSPQLYFSSARGIQSMREKLKNPLFVLMAMVGIVLVIACANVAVILLARNAARQRELSLRMALGSGRARLFRQLLTRKLAAGGRGSSPRLAVCRVGQRRFGGLVRTGPQRRPRPEGAIVRARGLGCCHADLRTYPAAECNARTHRACAEGRVRREPGYRQIARRPHGGGLTDVIVHGAPGRRGPIGPDAAQSRKRKSRTSRFGPAGLRCRPSSNRPNRCTANSVLPNAHRPLAVPVWGGVCNTHAEPHRFGVEVQGQPVCGRRTSR